MFTGNVELVDKKLVVNVFIIEIFKDLLEIFR